jgi:AraC-like DNA-binding protein
MESAGPPIRSASDLWRLAREGDLRGSIDAARRSLDGLQSGYATDLFVDLHLVIAFCSLRAGDYAEAARVLDVAEHAARGAGADSPAMPRVAVWRAELAYFQGRYSAAKAIVDQLVDELEQAGDRAYAAFALRIAIAILLARTDYDGIAKLASRAIHNAEASGDDYANVQILNVLGAAHFDCATSKLPEPHARAHLSALDLRDALPMKDEASSALQYFEKARHVAERGGYAFAAWYVSGNIERLEILLGRARRAIPAIRRRLRVLQQRGARYDEIVARSNLAWGLRTLGMHTEALHELDVALGIARQTGTFNVLLEFLEYDRSIVLGALGDVAASRASYRRYLRLAKGGLGDPGGPGGAAPAGPKRPLEPHFLKRADRYILDHLGERLVIGTLASQCGVGTRTLEKAFSDYRGVTPVAYVRNVRLDHAREAISGGAMSVGEVAARFGFRSPTTFANEYRKRFGVPPSRSRPDREDPV